MARRSAKQQPLPEWFNLSDYGFIPSMTNRDLIHEVILRVKGVNGISRLYQAKYIKHKLPKAGRLHDGSVPADLIEAINYANDLMLYREGRFAGAPILADITRGQAPNKVYKPVKLNKGEIDCLIDLHSYTDKEILQSLSDILPVLRNRKGIPEPTKSEAGTVGPSAIRRIIDYKVIPMLDLMLWAKKEGFEYSAEQLSRVLFPNEIVTAKHMTDTRIPFAKSFANPDYQDMVNLWLRQEGRDGKLNGDRLVGDECHDLTSIARQ